MTDYRKKIYDRYITAFGQSANSENKVTIENAQKAYRYYLRNWFPTSKKASVLELACGNGKLLNFFKSMGYENILGIDISPEQVAVARKNGVNVEQADVLEYLEKSEESYDLIVAIDLIEHLQKNEVMLFLELCLKKLEANGRIILQTPNPDSPFGMSVFCGDFTHETCFSPSGLSRLLRLHGFDSIEIREAGPVIHGVFSFIRFAAWKIFRLFISLWNLIETGSSKSGALSRVFLISAIKE